MARKKRTQSKGEVAAYVVLIFVGLWFGVSTVTFRIRHTWATEAEVAFVYLWEALTFQKVEEK